MLGGKILKRKNLKDFRINFTVNCENYMAAFRKNIFAYVEDKEITLNQIAEAADIPYSTLKTFLYSDSKDCNLSTAVKLARAFGVSVDRLIGAGTICQEVFDLEQAYFNLPKSSKSLIKWHINHEKAIHEQYMDSQVVSIMTPLCNGNGNMKPTSDYEVFDISNMGEELTHKLFFGIKIPCEHYLPHYTEGDVLLIANDRNAMKGEHSVIMVNDNILVTKRAIEEGVVKYYGLMDNRYRLIEHDGIQVVGYVAKTIKEK